MMGVADGLCAVFKQIGDLENAVEAFKSAVSWQLLLATCQELDYSEDDLQTTAQEIADLLTNLSRYREVPTLDFSRLTRIKLLKQKIQAAIIYEQYVKDPETAIVTLIDGGCYSEALRYSALIRIRVAVLNLAPLTDCAILISVKI